MELLHPLPLFRDTGGHLFFDFLPLRFEPGPRLLLDRLELLLLHQALRLRGLPFLALHLFELRTLHAEAAEHFLLDAFPFGFQLYCRLLFKATAFFFQTLPRLFLDAFPVHLLDPLPLLFLPFLPGVFLAPPGLIGLLAGTVLLLHPLPFLFKLAVGFLDPPGRFLLRLAVNFLVLFFPQLLFRFPLCLGDRVAACFFIELPPLELGGINPLRSRSSRRNCVASYGRGRRDGWLALPRRLGRRRRNG